MRARGMIAALCGANILIGFLVGFSVRGRCDAPTTPTNTAAVDSSLTQVPVADHPSAEDEAAAKTAPVTSDRRDRRRGRRGRGRGGRSRGMAHFMTRMLELDAEQVKKLEAVLSKTHQRFEQTMKPMRSKLDRIHKESEAEIRALLTPEQQKRFDAFSEKRRSWKRSRHRRGSRGRPDGPRGPRKAGERGEDRGPHGHGRRPGSAEGDGPGGRGVRRPRHDRDGRSDRGDRGPRRDRSDRGPRHDRPHGGDRHDAPPPPADAPPPPADAPKGEAPADPGSAPKAPL